MSREITSRVQDDLSEQLSGKTGSAADLRHEIETLEHDFDFDGYAPYTSQEIEVINELENEYHQEAEELCGDQTFKVTEWEQARRVYAGWLAYAAYSAIWEQTKQELIEAIEQFETDAESFGCVDPVISLNTTCIHGWAVHDRENADGMMFFESRQLDGCNGLSCQVAGVWLSVCFDPGVDSPKGGVR